MATLLTAAGILFVAAAVQSAIGFAFNLLAVPLLILSGLTLAQAVALTAVPILVQLLVTSRSLRDAIVWRDVLPAAAIRYATLPIGISLLYSVTRLPSDTVRQIVGGILLVILLSGRFARIVPRERLGWHWDLLAFGLSGIMLGMVSMGGPPVVLWLTAHDWSARRSRAFMAALFLLAAPVQIGLLYRKLGDPILPWLGWGLAATPLVILAATVGNRIGERFDPVSLRHTVRAFLFLTALVAIVSPFLH